MQPIQQRSGAVPLQQPNKDSGNLLIKCSVLVLSILAAYVAYKVLSPKPAAVIIVGGSLFYVGGVHRIFNSSTRGSSTRPVLLPIPRPRPRPQPHYPIPPRQDPPYNRVPNTGNRPGMKIPGGYQGGRSSLPSGGMPIRGPQGRGIGVSRLGTVAIRRSQGRGIGVSRPGMKGIGGARGRRNPPISVSSPEPRFDRPEKKKRR